MKYFCYLLLVGLMLGACGEQETPFSPIEKKEKVSTDENENARLILRWKRVYAEFRWNGFPWSNCSNEGYCGPCIGICVAIMLRLSPPESMPPSWGSAMVAITESGKLHFIPETQSMDNGDGLVRITEDWDLGAELADALDADNLIVKAGTYEIDYSSYPEFGEVFFDLLD